jgi:hypothetical protein
MAKNLVRGAQPLLHFVSEQNQMSAGEESDIIRHFSPFFRTVAPLSELKNIERTHTHIYTNAFKRSCRTASCAYVV